MANTSHTQMVVQGANFGFILPVTLDSDGKVDAVGTAIKVEAIENTEITFKNADTDSSVVEVNLDNGVKVEVEAVTKVLAAETGTEKSGSGSDAYDSIKFRTVEAAKAATQELIDLRGVYAFCCVGLGFNPQGTSEGYAINFGKLSGDIVRGTQGNQFVGMDVTILGKPKTASANFDESDLNGASGFGQGIEPMGGTAITKIIDSAAGTPNDLTAQELLDLLAGEVVMKDLPVA